MAWSRKGSWLTKKSKAPTVSPTMADLHWAAGFLEGEGSFTNSANIQIYASQTYEHEPIYKLQRLFGGSVILKTVVKGAPQLHWRVCGIRARGVGLTLYTLLSPRRRNQIRTMLGREA